MPSARRAEKVLPPDSRIDVLWRPQGDLGGCWRELPSAAKRDPRTESTLDQAHGQIIVPRSQFTQRRSSRREKVWRQDGDPGDALGLRRGSCTPHDLPVERTTDSIFPASEPARLGRSAHLSADAGDCFDHTLAPAKMAYLGKVVFCRDGRCDLWGDG